MSLFDSGPGLAQRWLGKSIRPHDSIDNEYDAVISCLNLHGTTSSDTDRGLGLDVVMDTLSLVRGFLRIRTGRLSLYRDFVEHPFKAGINNAPPEPFLVDWNTQSMQVERMAPVEGTLLTMLIPVEFR